MSGNLIKLTIILNDLSVMGGSFKSKYKHIISSDGAITYTVYNAVGLPLEKKEIKRSPKEAEHFFRALVTESNFLDWGSRYYSDACGGFRWEINAETDSGEHFNPHGYIKLPPNWSKFASLTADFTGIPLYVMG